MSSENRPVRKAWTRHARSLVLRKWLLVALGVALTGWATGAIVRHHKAAIQTAAVATQNPTPKADATKTPTPETAAAPQPTAPPSPETPPPGATPSAARPVQDLPTVSVALPSTHVVPSDRDTKQFGAVTMSDRKGRTFTIVPAAPPPASTPQRTASAAPPPAASSSSSPPRSDVFAPVGRPAVFSGHARVAGPLTLDVQGQTVQLFGVTLPTADDRCTAPNGTVKSCAVVAEVALTQKLAGHSIVACRVPPGQRGTLGAICLDEQGNDLGRYLVIDGLALADSSQSYDYLPAQGAARSAKRGLWYFR
ncbi:MAG: hypothetical protein KGQ82_04600 [Alphaproteobacteria bacterium]|nr:hypothetical protein [Alphaproteobacteria bacterium]